MASKAKARELKDIKLKEVSLVDKAANKKKFIFFKAVDDKKSATADSKKLKKKINIVIESDGTSKKTSVTVNGKKINNLESFSFSFWNSDDGDGRVSCSYSKLTEDTDGFKRTETFYLSKGDSQMNKKVQEKLQKYFGNDVKVDFTKADDSDTIVKALDTVNEYRSEFPDDLLSAVGTIAKNAGMLNNQKVEKSDDDNDDDTNEDETPVEKAGAKHSKATLKKITDALAALKSLTSELTGVEKSDSDSDDDDSDENKDKKAEVIKAIKDITKSIDKIENKQKDDEQSDITKALTLLNKRLKTVEKSTGVRKSLEDQDEDEDSNKDGDLQWPSFQ